MRLPIRLSLLFIIVIALSGCQTTKWLKSHRSEMQRLAYSDMDTKEKFDGLGNELAAVLDEGTNLSSPIKTLRYLKRFSDQNESELTSLINEIDGWQQGMKMGEKIAFGSSLLTKSYARKLVFLVPKVSKMVEQNDYKIGKLEQMLLLFSLKKKIRDGAKE